MIGVVYFAGGEIPSHPSRNRSELWDVATSTYTRWNPDGSVAETRPFTAAEVAEAQLLAAGDAAVRNRPTIEQRARQALATNQAFLALPDYPASPTTAQRDAAIRALIAQQRAAARQNNALIRIAIGLLDDVSDT